MHNGYKKIIDILDNFITHRSKIIDFANSFNMDMFFTILSSRFKSH